MYRKIRIGIFILVAITTVHLFAQERTSEVQNESYEGIKFTSVKFQEALALAEEEQKPLFVDVYTTWCGPCKVMDRNVFSHKEVGSAYNERFVNLKINAESLDGKAFSRKYRVQAYPTLMFINSKGEVFYRTEGIHERNQFIKLAEKAMKAYTN